LIAEHLIVTCDADPPKLNIGWPKNR
jgi:hypothetical protein